MSASNPLFGDLLLKLGVVSPGQVQEALALQALTGQRVGEALISLGYVSREQIQDALGEALGLNQQEKGPAQPPLGELLVGLKYVTLAQLGESLTRQRRDGRRLGEILVEQGHCTYKQIYEALGLQNRIAGRQDLPRPAMEGRRRVVVVDDSPLACAFVQEGLVALGYEVLCFQDPYEALEGMSRLQPAIVLSDLEMPGLDGVELCRRLKEGPRSAIPIIVLTANDREAERVRGLRAGADDYVNKSASMDELAARIESVVRRTGETERMRKLFARYTSDAVVEEILKSADAAVLAGEKREVTVLFADIRNFTGLAESLPPEQVVAVLNQVLGRLSDAVLTCGGTLDKFLGDGLMAVFGAPVGRSDDALRGLQCAKMMMEAFVELRAVAESEWVAHGREGRPLVLELGVGLNSGVVVSGNIGSALRAEYTCIGDAVNVAARLCALAGPGEILVGERTRELVNANETAFEDLPPVRLKGKQQPVPLYRAL
ncbi:response regulator [Corallococcus sp. bb12-1]|uniref:Adenylate/guanylate cyclase domain-containing response regulator n=1 Tax=Corallococcus terminator TaxID=2316733 RepID=A0A3A8I7T2_9BACT|nr:MULTISPECIES: adenylate/guanylate cyclase domain-containing protein [Corallococcus]MCY1041014.1 response regulator [Corallococcus sp. bb12-1]RKG79342.1 adenylate/guanylate cyclase domain-containing response regulator [Corallococcus terminator]